MRSTKIGEQKHMKKMFSFSLNWVMHNKYFIQFQRLKYKYKKDWNPNTNKEDYKDRSIKILFFIDCR